MISSIGKPLNNFFSWYLERRIVEIENFKSNPELVLQSQLSLGFQTTLVLFTTRVVLNQ